VTVGKIATGVFLGLLAFAALSGAVLWWESSAAQAQAEDDERTMFLRDACLNGEFTVEMQRKSGMTCETIYEEAAKIVTR
jgi:hypothetical protein